MDSGATHPVDLPSELAALRARIAALAPAADATAAALPFGVAAIDDRLAHGGLAGAALHEIAPASPALGDDAAATLFTAGIAARAAATRGMPVLWVITHRDLFAPGLALAGLGPERLIHAEADAEDGMLAAVEDGLRHGGLAAVIGETGRVGMAALRRLQLAAAEGGGLALLLRRWRRTGADPLAAPSVAVSRWRIGCAPSAPLPVAGVGRPRWQVALVRQRGGPGWEGLVEGCDAEGRLALPAGPGDRAASAGRWPGRRAA